MKQKMKFISIMGDSISTYENHNPCVYAVYYNHQMQKKNGLCSVYDTWWMKVSQRLQASICVNNSYSGSRVSGKDFPAGESRDRISNLKSGKYSPDYILIYMGINDFVNGVPDQIHCPMQIRKNTFEGAYNRMLKSIRTQYPNATVVCGTLMRTTIKDRNGWHFPEEYAGNSFEEYNHTIRRVCRKNRCCLADLSALDARYETLDGTHPTVCGHDMIATEWIRCLDVLGF